MRDFKNRELASKIWTALLTNPNEQKNRLTASSINIIENVLNNEYNCTNCYYFNRPSNICKNCDAINGNFTKWEKNEPKPANNCGYPISEKLEF